MWAAIAAVGGLGTILSLAVWAFRAYAAKKNADAVQSEREAGAALSQQEATNAEIKRTQDAADAGNAVTDSLRDITDDPNNRAGK